MKVITIKNLTKRFGEKIAVDNLSLEVEEGEIFGLLGPNGAGKSTTINILTGLLKSNRGDIEIFGKSFNSNEMNIKRNIGVVPQSLAIYDSLTAVENVKFFAGLFGLNRRELNEAVEYALEFTGLLEHRNSKAKNFSGGMMRRLNIACAIAHKPKLVIMDEPTVGIDPQSRNHILKSVKKLNKEGCTIVYTSHYMEEVEELCNRIVIIDHGKVIAGGTKEQLISLVSDTQSLEVEIDELESIDERSLKDIPGVKNLNIKENSVVINSIREVNNLDKIINYFTSNNVSIRNIGYKKMDLETVFLSLTGRKLRD
ncbi:antibiotic ABC transporter ATP-binding protein [Clostridium polyendosporum]|uniref:Antibiotic ABC transporter ATP-binding protein n=1 Tax=Clostridium polyendosporum TaxID=69208 RepID=A0A919VLF0_9CLOT|nr:ABC transporter ATP-binding protein [Clostridium polyendosporum]GIM28533.1 antibiotic ABC transporter ATP-binding protein [Clostridium polyendosporum]